MDAEELKSLRKGMALTQEGLARALNLSRKTVNEMERGGIIPLRTQIAVRELARKQRLIEDTYWVESTHRDTYAVARRTVRQREHPTAMFYAHSEVVLYGEFKRRDHAYRWCAALRSADNPRATKKLTKSREEEIAAALAMAA